MLFHPLFRTFMEGYYSSSGSFSNSKDLKIYSSMQYEQLLCILMKMK